MDEISKEVKQKLTELSAYWSTQYEQMGKDLEFSTGKQWEEPIIKQRKKRPTLVLNMIPTYVKRIVNSVKMAPFGIEVNSENTELASFISSLIGGIEYNSNAATAYEKALDHSVRAGLGFIVVTNEYTDDESLEQTIRINSVKDPRQVMIDPHAEDVGDARYGIYYTHVDKNWAKEVYGNEVNEGSEYFDIFESFSVPEDSVVDLYYYKLASTEKMKFWYEDGTSSFDLDESKVQVGSRKVAKKTLKVYHFVGQKLINETEIAIPYIPIIPVYGSPVFEEGLRYAGLVREVHDAQVSVNYLASTEQELIASAPKNPWVIAATQVQGHENVWARAATEPAAFLTYNPVPGVESPKRENNVAQTQSLQAAKQLIQSDFGRLTGIFDPKLGAGGTEESGVALGIKNMNSEIATAGSIDALENAITQVGKVVLALLPIIYDTERNVQVKGEEGKLSYVKANVSEVLKQLGNNVSVFASAGPSYESKRKEGLKTLLDLSHMLPADKATALLDLIVGQVEVGGKAKVVERVKKIMDPALVGESNVDPQAQQALDAAKTTISEQQATIGQANQIITNMQTYMLQKDKEMENKMLLETAKIENQYRIELLKQNGADTRQQEELSVRISDLEEKLNHDANVEILKAKQNKEQLDFDKQKHAASTATELIKTALPSGVNPKTVG